MARISKILRSFSLILMEIKRVAPNSWTVRYKLVPVLTYRVSRWSMPPWCRFTRQGWLNIVPSPLDWTYGIIRPLIKWLLRAKFIQEPIDHISDFPVWYEVLENVAMFKKSWNSGNRIFRKLPERTTESQELNLSNIRTIKATHAEFVCATVLLWTRDALKGTRISQRFNSKKTLLKTHIIHIYLDTVISTLYLPNKKFFKSSFE